jgi:hypothetical protein
MSPISKSKFFFTNSVFPGVMGLTIPSYSVCLNPYCTCGPLVYIFPVYTVYTHFSTIYLFFLIQQECKVPKTIVFGMVHSQKLVVVLLHKHFTPRNSIVLNSINNITNCGAHSSAVCSDCAISQLQVRFQIVSLMF